ncbi:MAG: OmpA family protein [Flavobacteriales bacterium]
MTRLLTSTLLILNCSLLTAQNQDLSAHRDCNNPLEVIQCFVPDMKVPDGYGNRLEISGYSIKSPYFFTREHNTLWIKLVFVQDAEFEFELVPVDPNEDFDFIIFKNEEDICTKITRKQATPVRSNLTRVNPEKGSKTGLKAGYTNEFAAAGPGNAYSAPLSVKAGEEYLMVIDCPYGSKSGFKFEMDTTLFVEPVPVEVVRDPEPTKNPYPSVYIQFVEKGQPLKITTKDFAVKGMTPEEVLKFDEKTGSYQIENVQKFRTYAIYINKQGYELYNEIYSQRKETDTTLVVELKKLEVGTKLKFENINFVMDRAQIMPNSEDELKKITEFLKNNPNIHVEIMGHVNGPGTPNKKAHKKLSNDRAKAVYDHLKKNGIETNRITYAGYGNTKMIYPSPTNEAQSKANRRVELRVTKL